MVEEVSNATPIKKRKPEDIFGVEKAKEYEDIIDALWDNLVYANASIFVIDHVVAFPVELLLAERHRIFLQLVLRNFERSILLTITNFFEEGDNRTLTFRNLKKWIKKNRRAEVEPEMTVYISDLKPATDIADIRERAKRVRDNIIAHLNLQVAIDVPTRAKVGIDLRELRKLLDETTQLVDKLFFGHGRSMLYPEYMPGMKHPEGMDPRSDIEYFLDSLARDSAVLRMPEKRPKFWPHYAKNITLEDRATFNH